MYVARLRTHSAILLARFAADIIDPVPILFLHAPLVGPPGPVPVTDVRARPVPAPPVLGERLVVNAARGRRLCFGPLGRELGGFVTTPVYELRPERPDAVEADVPISALNVAHMHTQVLVFDGHRALLFAEGVRNESGPL